MYAKLIWRNARRSFGDYLIYIVTLTLCVAMFYAFLSIASDYYQPDIGAEFDLSLLGSNTKRAVLGITLLLLFLIKYVNNFMLLRRQREFAVQTVMGMEQKTTALLFFAETLIMGAAALVIGIFAGVLLAQIITAMQLKSLGYPYQVTWTLYPDTCLLTILFFLASFTVIGLMNVRTIRKIKVIDMLQAQRQGDSAKKSRWMPAVLLLFTGSLIMMLLTGISKKHFYFDARFPFPAHLVFYANIILPALGLFMAAVFGAARLSGRKWPMNRLAAGELALDFFLLFFSACVPVIRQKYMISMGAGTINAYAMFLLMETAYAVCAFIYLIGDGITLLKERSLRTRYHEENLFLFGQLQFRLKTTAKTMTLICLTLMVSIGLFLSIPALTGWATGYLEERSVFGVRIASTYNKAYTTEELPGTDENYAFVTDFLEKEGIGTADDCAFSLCLLQKEQFHNRIKTEFPVLAVSLTDYNHLRRMQNLSPITLEEGTFTTQWRSAALEDDIEAFLQSHAVIETDAGQLRLSRESAHHAPMSEYIYNLYTDVVYVVPDDICAFLMPVERHRYINTTEPMPYQTAVNLEALFTRTLPTDLEKDGAGYLIRTASVEISDTRSGIFILKTSMTYAAVMLFISCFTILALQQLMDASNYRSRFATLRNMGVKDTRIKRLIRKQLAFWFSLPVLTALAGAAIFIIYFFRIISIEITAYVGPRTLFIQITAITAILLFLLLCYYATTRILFQRIVFERK